MQKAGHSSCSAFTLLELSIVLVIIGLIIGGILVGRSLVEIAEARAQVAQVTQIKTAIRAFYMKYNCYPGDCATAEEQGLGMAGGQGKNGNGNGMIARDNHPSAGLWSWQENTENANFFYHLHAANLVGFDSAGYQDAFQDNPDHLANYKRIYYNLKDNPAGGVLFPIYLPVIVDGDDLPLTYEMGNSLVSITGASSLTSDLKPTYNVSTAIYIDSKMDDGKPLSGNVGCSYLWGGVLGFRRPNSSFAVCSIDGATYSNVGNEYNTAYGDSPSVGMVFGKLF